MSDNTQTTPFGRTLPKVAQNEIINDALQQGYSLPVSVVSVSNAFVTVKFEMQSSITFPNIEVPQAISRYARPPTQIGDKGFVVSADAFLGGMTGKGTGTAVYGRKEANLAALVFVPLSNTAFETVDPNAYTITAPNGAVIKDDSGASKITILPGSITISSNGSSIVIDASGVKIMGKDFLTHKHVGVQTGTSDTGNVL